MSVAKGLLIDLQRTFDKVCGLLGVAHDRGQRCNAVQAFAQGVVVFTQQFCFDSQCLFKQISGFIKHAQVKHQLGEALHALGMA